MRNLQVPTFALEKLRQVDSCDFKILLRYKCSPVSKRQGGGFKDDSVVLEVGYE